MPFVAPITIDEKSYQVNLNQILILLPFLKDYLSERIHLVDEQLIIDIPRSFYKATKTKLQKMGELYNNPVALAWFYAEDQQPESQIFEERDKLLTQANEYVQSKEYSPPQQNLPQDITFDNLFEKLLQQDGIHNLILGESHGQVTSLLLILKNIKTLQEKGALVVIENFNADSIQIELDRCYNDGQLTPLAELLTPVIHEANAKEAAKLKVLMLDTLFKHGIRVVAGDNEVSSAINENYKKERYQAMNYVMVNNVEQYKQKHLIPPNTPVVYLTGDAHALTAYSYPGLVQLTNGIHIKAEDTKKASDGNYTANILSNKKVPTVSVKANPKQALHILLELNGVAAKTDAESSEKMMRIDYPATSSSPLRFFNENKQNNDREQSITPVSNAPVYDI